MRAAKVVFVNRYFAPDQSATSRLVTDLASRLAERGIAVSVVTSRQRYEDPDAALPARESLGGVQVYRVDAATRGRARLGGRALDYATFHAAASLTLLRHVSRGDVVVAKTDPPLISVTASYAARLKHAALINWLQDMFPEVAEALTPDLLPHPLARGLTAARDRSLQRAAINIVLSEGMRERLIAHGVARRASRSYRTGPTQPASRRARQPIPSLATGLRSPSVSSWDTRATSAGPMNSILCSGRRNCCAASRALPF